MSLEANPQNGVWVGFDFARKSTLSNLQNLSNFISTEKGKRALDLLKKIEALDFGHIVDVMKRFDQVADVLREIEKRMVKVTALADKIEASSDQIKIIIKNVGILG